MRKAVRDLCEAGLAPQQIADKLGISKGTVAFHMRRLDLPPDERFARRYDWSMIRAAYEEGLSLRECRARFGFTAKAWYDAIALGDVVPRPTAMPIEELFVSGPKRNRHHLKWRLLRGGLKENKCEECGLTEWRGEPINMALHHVNGQGNDNRLVNPKFLCPNCHAQTPTYGGRNGHRRKPVAG